MAIPFSAILTMTVYHSLITKSRELPRFFFRNNFRNTFRNKDNGDIDTYIGEDYIIEYTCPRCKATRRYKDQFVTDRIKKNIAGVELYHTKDNLGESDVQKFFRSGLRTATLLDNTDK